MSTLHVELPPDLTTEEARLLLAIKLWETEKLSLGQAARFAGYSKRAFIEILNKHGLPVLGASDEELDAETRL
jgi:predicted HTH domain antitoxin